MFDVWNNCGPVYRSDYFIYVLLFFVDVVATFNDQVESQLILSGMKVKKISEWGDPNYRYVGCFTERPELYTESIYSKSPQTCIDICEHQFYNYAVLSGQRCFCSESIVDDDRQDDVLCNIRCLANKLLYCGGVDHHSYYATGVSREETLPHLNLQIANTTEHSILLKWLNNKAKKVFIFPNYKTGTDGTETLLNLTNFLIRSNVVHSYSSLPFFPQPEFIVQNTENRFEITDLHPATTYNITVEALCGSVICESASLIGETEIGEPSPVPKQPRIIETTKNTTTIQISPIKNDNGPVSKVLIIVENVEDTLSQPFDETLLGNWQEAQENGVPYYITAELNYQDSDVDANTSRVFVVGDGQDYRGYFNAPLDNEKAHIHMRLGVISVLNDIEKRTYSHSSHEQHTLNAETFSYATFEAGQESIIALAVTCTVFAICFLLSLITYFYLRLKTCQIRNRVNRLTSNTHEMMMQQPIIERENNGLVMEDEPPVTSDRTACGAASFKQQLNKLLDGISPSMRLPRSALRLNVNDVLADGYFGEVISGTLIHVVPSSPEMSNNCQLHVLALDELSSENQLKLIKDFTNLVRLPTHENILDFYGVSASPNCFYLIFEHQKITLKRRLIESRRAPNTVPIQRISALSEQLVLQWIYEITNALQFLANNQIIHRQICSHNIFVTASAKIKLSIFGPIPLVNNQRKIDITRWLAPEVLRYQHYSVKSDVWGLGCVAWECCTLGGTPYPNITSNHDLLLAIKGGARPARPSFVYDDLYQLLLNCWQLEPLDRTKFEDIAFTVRQLMISPKHALSFDRVPEPHDSNILDTLPFYLPMLEQYN